MLINNFRQDPSFTSRGSEVGRSSGAFTASVCGPHTLGDRRQFAKVNSSFFFPAVHETVRHIYHHLRAQEMIVPSENFLCIPMSPKIRPGFADDDPSREQHSKASPSC